MNNYPEEYARRAFEMKKLFHSHRSEDSIEEKYKIFLKLQELHIKFKKVRGEPLKPFDKVWE